MADGWVLKINGDSKGAVRAVDDLGDSTKTLTGRERALVGVLAGVAAATAVAMKAAINYGDWLEKTAQKTGVSTEALSSYKLGAELAGTTQEGLISGLQRLQKNMGAALRSPTSAAATAFKSLGVEFQNADGSLRDVEDLLPDVAAAMAGMADGTLKTQIAMDLMGRSGAELIPMLNQGADGLKDMRAESEELGVVWTQQDAVAAAELNDALTRLKTTFAGMVQEATRYWLPTFVDIAEGALLAAEAITGLDAAEKRREEHLETTRDAISLRAEELEGMRVNLEAWEEMTDAQLEGMDVSRSYQAEMIALWQGRVDRQREVVRRTVDELGEEAGIGRAYVERLREERLAHLGAAGAAGEAAGARAGAAAGMTEAEKAARELTRQLTASEGSVVSLQRSIETMGLEGEEAIRARALHAVEDLLAELDRLDEVPAGANADLYNSLWDSLREQIRLTQEAADEEVAIFRSKEEEKAALAAESLLERQMTEEQARDATIGSLMASLDVFADFTRMVTEIVAEAYGESSKEAKEAQTAMFVTSKAIALGNAIINTALAISNGLAIPPPPVGAALAIIAGIAGAAQIATIVGTTIAGVADAGLPPEALRAAGLNQHTVIAMRNDEMVLDPTGTKHISEMLAMQKQGMGSSGPTSIRTTVEIDGEVLGEVVDRHLIRSAEKGTAYGSRIRYGERTA